MIYCHGYRELNEIIREHFMHEFKNDSIMKLETNILHSSPFKYSFMFSANQNLLYNKNIGQ